MNQTASTQSDSPSQANGLSGKSVVIFGGTSGIGLAAAIQAKAIGADVIVIGNDVERTKKAAAENGMKGWRAADVTKKDAIYAALEDIPKVDHLVLFAGTYVVGKILEADVDYLRQAFEQRVWAAVHAIRALGDRLAKDGSITLISGALTDRPTAQGTAILAAASATMDTLARGLALELAPIRVNALSPGLIDTPLLGKVLGESYEAAVAAMSKAAPLKRLGTSEQAGAATVFLMTNGWMSGETLHVDGATRFS